MVGHDPAGSQAATRELVRLYLRGQHGPARRLFEIHRELLLKRVRSHPLARQTRTRASAEDIVSEVFVRALSSGLFDRFEDRGPGSLRNALFTVLERTLVDMLRRAGTVKRGANARPLSLDEVGTTDGTLVDAIPSRDPNPSSLARSHELEELCRSVLEEREWRAWQLVEMEGRSSAEAAERLGSSPAAIRGLLFRARAKLVRALDDRTDTREHPGS